MTERYQMELKPSLVYFVYLTGDDGSVLLEVVTSEVEREPDEAAGTEASFST